MASIVQLGTPVHANARRYSDQEREAAYLLWKSTGRSRRRVAAELGISPGTLANWHRDDAWTERAEREDAEDSQGLRSAISGLVLAEVARSLDVVKEIRDDKSGKVPPRERLNAAIYLLGIAGVSAQRPVADATARPESLRAEPEDDGPSDPIADLERHRQQQVRARSAGA